MNLETAIKGIMAIRERIHAEHLWNDPVSLSDTAVKLSVYNAYLADNLAELHYDSTKQRIEGIKKLRALKVPVTEANEVGKLEALEARKTYENTKTVYKTTSDLISVIQTRIRVMENQRKQEGLAT